MNFQLAVTTFWLAKCIGRLSNRADRVSARTKRAVVALLAVLLPGTLVNSTLRAGVTFGCVTSAVASPFEKDGTHFVGLLALMFVGTYHALWLATFALARAVCLDSWALVCLILLCASGTLSAAMGSLTDGQCMNTAVGASLLADAITVLTRDRIRMLLSKA